jgi:pimeloyl-ACP methyl ester carboxylesterase
MKANWVRQKLFLTIGVIVAFTLIGCVSSLKPTLKATNFSPAKVDTCGPDESFWEKCVHYPFPAKYKKAKDSQGVAWEIGYMDEYYGKEPNPKVLVIIHGKGANAGHYGNIMKFALECGLRVIAPDIPNYGKSIPGNLDNPVTRTLDDSREAIHDLIVKQLGVEKAYYLGHSLGGQFVLGYAIRYPQAVSGLILQSSAGLEEFATNLGKAPLFDPAYMRNYETWEKIWGNNLKGEFGKDEEAIRLFNDFKKKDPETGRIVASKAGYFKNNSEYAKFLTEVRVKMIKANKAEYERYVITYIRDIYALGIEIRKEDPNSYVKRTKEIKCPIFLAFGNKEPFIPTTLLSGKKSLNFDIIQPFYKEMKAAGNAPIVKLYDGAAHFVHTDKPVQFPKDCVTFITQGKVAGDVDPMKFKKPKYIEDLPADIQAFLDELNNTVKANDLEKIMTYYSDKFLEDGSTKKDKRGLWKQYIKMMTSYKWKLSKCEVKGNIAHVAGVMENNFGAPPIPAGTMLIKENGQWKLYGNQK